MRRFVEKTTDCYLIFCIYAFLGWLFEVGLFLIKDHKFINRGYLFGPYLPIYGIGMLILLFIFQKFITKRHETNNMAYASISTITIITFIYVSIIEYTVPKIHRVDTFFQTYGIGLLLINVIGLLILNALLYKTDNSKLKHIDTTPILVFLGIWIITTTLEFISHYAIEEFTGKMLWNYSNEFLNINKRVNWDASKFFAIGGTIAIYLVQPLIHKFLIETKKSTKLFLSIIILIPMIIDLSLKLFFK